MNEAITILHVEDNLAHAALFRRHVEQLCPLADIVHLTDGEVVLSYIDEQLPKLESMQLLLLDMHLPKISGLEVLARVRATPLLDNLPVVILTTSNAPADIDNAYRSGANGYLVKPLENGQMREVTKNICEFWLKWNVV